MSVSKKFNYFKKTYENPYFREKKFKPKKIKNRREVNWKGLFIKLGIISIVVLVIWFFFYSSLFKIKNVKVTGASRISASELENFAWEEADKSKLRIFSESNIFIFNSSNLSNRIKNAYFLAGIKISKKFPSTISINVQEASYSVIWSEGGNNFLVNEEGRVVAVANADDVAKKEIPLIENRGDAKIKDAFINNGSEVIKFAIELSSAIKDFQDFKISHYFVDNDIDTLKVQLESGLAVYLSTKEDAKKQLSKLQVLKNEQLKEDFNHKSYYDLRYGDRVYYK